MKNESAIEVRFGKELAKFAAKWDIPYEYIKFTAPGRKGFPDRLIVWGPSAKFLFIEWKMPGQEPRPLQKYIHGQLNRLGTEVKVYDNWRIAMEEVSLIIGAEAGASPWHEDDSKLAWSKAVLTSGKGKDRYCPKGIFSPEEIESCRCSTCNCPIAGHYD